MMAFGLDFPYFAGLDLDCFYYVVGDREEVSGLGLKRGT